MKLKKFALVMGAAVAVTAAHADVATTDYPVHDVTLHLTSATAVRDTFQRMMNRYCNTAFPYNVYVSGAGSDANNFRAYECTFHTVASSAAVGPEIAARGLAGKKVLVYHTVEVSSALGGSIVGVMPVYRAIPMQFVTAGLDAACPLTTPAGANPFDTHTCAAAARHFRLPNAGASDTEPGSFTGINLAGAGVVVNAALPSLSSQGRVDAWKAGLTDVEKGLGDSKAMFGVGFGVAATKFAKTAGLTNLKHSQVASLLAGSVEDWSQILPNLSGPVKVCRRTQGSGTQASFNAMFNFNPCLTGSQAALPVATAPGGGGLTVVENSTTGGVKSCLTAANTANELAIGILSLENNEVAAGWEFVALNGVDPFQNPETSTADGVPDRIREDFIANGMYPYYQEVTMQWYTKGQNGTGICVDDPDSSVVSHPPESGSVPHSAAAATPFCHAGEIRLAPTNNSGSTGVVPNDDSVPGGVLSLALLIRDNAGNPEITKNTVLTSNLPGVLSLPFWWTQSPYSGFRITPSELSQGINNYTRNGLSCQPSVYAP